MKRQPTLTTKNGEPSVHLSQKAFFTAVIVSSILIIVCIGIAARMWCCDCEKDCKKTPETSTAPTGKETAFRLKEGRLGTISPGKETPFTLKEKRIGKLDQADITRRIRAAREHNVASKIGQTFREEVKKPLKENYMATPKHVWHAPPGVQPGTLVTPPIGYTRVASTVDRGVMNTTQPIAKYSWSPEQKVSITDYVNRDGTTTKGPNRQFGDSAPNGLGYYGGVRQEKLVGREMAIMDELGSTGHDFQKSNNLQDGITGETWEGDKPNWAALRSNTETSLRKISKMFDQLLVTQIFPSITKVETHSGQFRVKVGDGKCISLERYYEWVKNCFRVQLGLAPEPMPWAEGSSIKLGFENIDASLPDLRQGLMYDCDSAPEYSMNNEGNIKSSATDGVISYSVIWPKTMDLLYTHFLKIN